MFRSFATSLYQAGLLTLALVGVTLADVAYLEADACVDTSLDGNATPFNDACDDPANISITPDGPNVLAPGPASTPNFYAPASAEASAELTSVPILLVDLTAPGGSRYTLHPGERTRLS
jgi:hypothetical protein